MRNIFFSDPHISEEAIPELELIFKEIISYKKHADCLICGGDYYEKKNPSSVEIEFGTKWAKIFRHEFPAFWMIEGNHPSISADASSVKYLQYLDVPVVIDKIIDEVYYGHFMVKESACGFEEKLTYNDLLALHSGTVDYKVDLKRYILGHQHTYQEHERLVHPGSVRYVDFGEVKDKHKYILLVEDGDILPIILNKVRPMYEVTKVADLANLPAHAQVRLVVNDFEQFKKEVQAIDAYKNKFFKFKVKLNFERNITSNSINMLQNNQEIIMKWLDTVKDIDVKAELVDELKKVGVC